MAVFAKKGTSAKTGAAQRPHAEINALALQPPRK